MVSGDSITSKKNISYVGMSFLYHVHRGISSTVRDLVHQPILNHIYFICFSRYIHHGSASYQYLHNLIQRNQHRTSICNLPSSGLPDHGYILYFAKLIRFNPLRKSHLWTTFDPSIRSQITYILSIVIPLNFHETRIPQFLGCGLQELELYYY